MLEFILNQELGNISTNTQKLGFFNVFCDCWYDSDSLQANLVFHCKPILCFTVTMITVVAEILISH